MQFNLLKGDFPLNNICFFIKKDYYERDKIDH